MKKIKEKKYDKGELFLFKPHELQILYRALKFQTEENGFQKVDERRLLGYLEPYK